MLKPEIIQQPTIPQQLIEAKQSDVVQIFTSPTVLTALSLLLLVLFILILFRKVITGFITNKATKISVGGNKGLVVEGSMVLEKEQKDDEQAISEPISKEEKDKEIEKTEDITPVTLDDWQRKMFIALVFEKSQEKAVLALEKIKILTHDIKLVKENEIDFWRLSYTMLGNIDSIKKISEFVKEPSLSFYAYSALGSCFNHSEDFKKSIENYNLAYSLATTDEDKESVISPLSSVLYKDNQKPTAFDIIEKNIAIVKLSEISSKLYENLASLYEKENNFELRAFALEKALELRPNNTDLLFSTAYSYAKDKFDDLALFHYKQVASLTEDNQGTTNNLGVQYEKADMPIASVENYKKSIKKGETLASANLAYRYMNAGFFDEAQEVINEAKLKDDVHPNVGSALSDLAEKKEKEQEQENDLVKRARRQKKFVLAFSEALFTSASCNIASKVLTNQDSVDFNFKNTDGFISLTWSEKDTKYRIRGNIKNRALRAKWRRLEYDLTEKDYLYKNYGEAFLFILGDNTTLEVMLTENKYTTRNYYFHFLK